MKKDPTPRKLGKIARDNAFELETLAAQGIENAAIELYQTARFATYLLEVLSDRMSYQNPNPVVAIAQQKFFWPVLYGSHRGLKKSADELIESLQLGAKTGLNLRGKSFEWDPPANQVAIYLLQLGRALQRAPISKWDENESLLSFYLGRWGGSAVAPTRQRDKEQLHALERWGQIGTGRQLPPLSKGTANDWAKATPELFRLVFGKTFDSHPLLEGLKSSIVGHAKTWRGEPGGPGIIRAAMLRKVQQAWHSIAALD